MAAFEEEAGVFLEDTACLEDVFPAEEVDVLELAGGSDETEGAELSKALTSFSELVSDDMGSLELEGKDPPCRERSLEQALSSSAPVNSAAVEVAKSFLVSITFPFCARRHVFPALGIWANENAVRQDQAAFSGCPIWF